MRTLGSVDHWFDTSCFTTPAPFQLGNSGAGKVHGPGYRNADLSLFKTFDLREGMRLAVQIDSFNATNTPHYGNPDTNLSDSNFGQISGTNGTPRQLQLGAHFTFSNALGFGGRSGISSLQSAVLWCAWWTGPMSMNRRRFTANGIAAALAPYLHTLPLPGSAAGSKKINLVPDAPCLTPNYWCTWSVQNYMYGQGDNSLSIEKLEGGAGSQLAHDAMAESVLLGPDGWARNFFPQARQELYLMLDDGWESGGTSTFELDKAKFPSFRGSAMERLRGLNLAIRDEGWRSAAVWCRNTPGGAEDDRLEELRVQAGIPYWKVDGGDPEFHLTALTLAKHCPLAIEHVHGEGPVNGDWRKNGRFGPQPPGSRRQQILAHTDVYRTYDVTAILSLPTTLDRTAEMLKGAEGQTGIHALLNVEDEVYLAATLGCTMGVMRHPLRGKRPDGGVDLFFNGPRQAKRRMDEATRAIRWQRIAAPFSPGIGTVNISSQILQDTWHFKRGETWDSELIEQTVHQSAPAAITRNLELPRVTARGDKPFVMASRFPNGAVALCAHERTQLDRAWYMPACSVELDVADAPGPYAIFGCVDSTTLTFDQPRTTQRLFAQDLLGTEATDITHQLTGNGRRLTLHQADLRRIGLTNATAGDLSSPGLVLAWRDR